MKKLIILLILAITLGAGMMGAMPGLSQAQVAPPPTVAPPPAPYAAPPAVAPAPYPTGAPYIGPGTPWVYYAGDWFLNGILYYFFGPQYGWAPYYAYPETYIVRPGRWYGSKWARWYSGHPAYVQKFHQSYPIWHGHTIGHRYGEAFYNKYHPGQGGGWHHGVAGHVPHK